MATNFYIKKGEIMNIIEKWEDGARWLWCKFGRGLQSRYDEIDSWKTPVWVKNTLDDIWKLLSPEIQKKLYKLVMEICKNYDDEFARELLYKLKSMIKKYFIK